MMTAVGAARIAATLGVGALVLALVTGPARATGPSGPDRLVGSFSVTSGACAAAGTPSGSYLELTDGGIPVPNPASPCAGLGQLFTPLAQGTEGLVTGQYQLDPVPTFDADGDALATAIIRPAGVLGAKLALVTTCADQQVAPTPTGGCVGLPAGRHPVPTLWAEVPGTGGCPGTASTDCLYGDLSSLSVDWSGFPVASLLSSLLPLDLPGVGQATCATDDGCYSEGVADGAGLAHPVCVDGGSGCSLAGTFAPRTGAYTLDVQSPISFGLLRGMTAHYVLTGTFTTRTAVASPLAGLGSLGAPGAAPRPGSASGSASTPGGGSGPGAGSAPGAGAGGSGAAGPGPAASDSPPSGAAGSGDAGAPSMAAPSPTGPTGGIRTLDGRFVLGPVSCPRGAPSGSYLQISGLILVSNPDSTCDGGAYTLLPPGTTGLPTARFAPDPDPTFDAAGNSLAGAIVRPVPFSGHDLGMATSPEDEQDAPSGPATFSAPSALLQGTSLVVDLRSLEVTYNGPPGASCASSAGLGCWESGSRAALGTYDPATSAFTLDWFTGQAFTGASAGVEFHLAGRFVGDVASAPAGTQLTGLPPQYVVTNTMVVSGDAPGGPTGSAPEAGVARRGPRHVPRARAHHSQSAVAALGVAPGVSGAPTSRAADLDGPATLAGLLLAVVGVAVLLLSTGERNAAEMKGGAT